MIINGDQREPVLEHWNFGKFILDHLRNANPHDVCLENYTTGEQLTYSAFTEYAVSLSVGLSQLGVKKGDIVGVGSERRITFLPTNLAVIFTGAASTPYDLRIGRAVLRHKLNLVKPSYFICSSLFWNTYGDIIKDCGFIKTVICFEDNKDIGLSIKKIMSNSVEVDNFEPAAVERPADTALILYSSGTTGMPKAVLVTHLGCIFRSIPDGFQDEFLKTELSSGEWFHSYQIFMSFGSLRVGRKVVMADNLAPDSANIFFKIVQDCQINSAVMGALFVSNLAKAENQDKYNLNSLRVIYSAGSALHSTLIEKVETRFPNLKTVLQVYGMTEAGIMTSQGWGTKGPKAGSVGMCFPGSVLKVVDLKTRKTLGPNERGEICVRGKSSMSGYIGMDMSDYLDDEGFLSSGDLGFYDNDSYFYIVDRIKELFYYDGFQVNPLELEMILMSHPGVSEVAIVGKPAGDFGEEPTAFIVRQPEASLTEQDIIDYVTPEVSPWMQLRGGVKFVSELPRNLNGKILRRQLKGTLIN